MSRARSTTPAVLAFVLLAAAAAFLFGPSGDRGRSAPAASPAESTEAREGRTAPDLTRDLSADERRGGHTLARHVGLGESDLNRRLEREPNLTAASSFFDRATAERAVAVLLERERADVERWQRSDRARLVIEAEVGRDPVGLTLRRGAPAAERVRGARAVLVRDGAGWFVLTAYPEDSR